MALTFLLPGCQRLATAAAEDHLSDPQRAGLALGLVEQRALALPSWAQQTTVFWVKTTDGACASFSGSLRTDRSRLDRELCRSTGPDGAEVSEHVGLDVLPDPKPPPRTDGGYRPEYYRGGPQQFSDGGPLIEFDVNVSRRIVKGHEFSGSGASGRIGPWYATASDGEAIRFESMVRASFRLDEQTRPCTPESVDAQRAALAQSDPVRDGRRRCLVEGEAVAERVIDFEGILCTFPREKPAPEPVDCRLPCEARPTADQEPNPLYRDPTPEVVFLFRTKDACSASTTPGRFSMPPPDCGVGNQSNAPEVPPPGPG